MMVTVQYNDEEPKEVTKDYAERLFNMIDARKSNNENRYKVLNENLIYQGGKIVEKPSVNNKGSNNKKARQTDK